MNAAELGHALHQTAHLKAEVLFDLLGGDVGVFDNIVQEARRNHAGTGTDIAQQVRHCNRMANVGLAAGTHLTVVQLKGEMEGRSEQAFSVGGATVTGTGGHVLNAAAQPLGQLDAVIGWAMDLAQIQLSSQCRTRCRRLLRSSCLRCAGHRLEHAALPFSPSYAAAETNRPHVRVCRRNHWQGER